MHRSRSVLEVLKWTSPSDLCALSLTNRLWAQSANSDEVWRELCETCGLEGEWKELTVKMAFLRQYKESRRFMLANGYLSNCNVRGFVWEKPIKVKGKVAFGSMSSIVLYPPYIIVTGTANPVSGQSALINYTNGTVSMLPNMQNPRCHHSSALYKGTIYVFAGSNDREMLTDTAEKLQLHKSTQWTALNQMSCRAGYLSLCRKCTVMYLISGFGTNICQQFEMIREEFSVLPFKMPRNDAITRVFEAEGYVFFVQREWKGQWSGEIGVMPVMYKSNMIR